MDESGPITNPGGRLYCKHRWYFFAHDSDKDHDCFGIRKCDWCHETWRSFDPEPEVEIAYIK